MGKNQGAPRPFLEEFTEALKPFEKDRIPDWDEYFHAIAQTVALRSKDPSRKVGAVIVGGDGHVILSTGFNWLPRGVREDPQRTEEKKEKLCWITHAETNAIFNAARAGISLVGSTIYVTTFPCTACAQAIVQAGIRRVYTYGEYWKNDPSGYEKALDIFAEAGVATDAPMIRHKDHELRRQKGLKKARSRGRKTANDRSSRGSAAS